MADDALNPETPPLNADQASFEATVGSTVQGGTESSCNHSNVETSGLASDGDREKSLGYAEELMERGSKAAEANDYAEATECYSRALEIRVAHYGELAPECVNMYYKYGCALLYKAQEEGDPLATVPKKEGESQQLSAKSGPVSNNGELEETSNPECVPANACSGKDQEDDEEESEAESAEGDEDESDLDLAWKMLDVARAIVEKHLGDTMEKVDILSALAEVALEREDIETSLSDYLRALDILERLVEPDSRRIAELNFRICLCLEIGSKAQEAIPYCQKAISICKTRVQRLSSDLKCSSKPTMPDCTVQLSSSGFQSNDSVTDKEAEIETLNDLSGELEKKLEDLQQLVSNPTSILSDILEMISAKARGTENPPPAMSSSQLGVSSSSGNLDSPAVSTQTNGAAGVTNLGVVGRGVKRVVMNSITVESSPLKKPGLDLTADKGDGKAS
ncbi:NASP-related protein sim3-like [Rhododendron vialii]|uniref:NASP-related protein sim3-like n=1 Tax=Rhododendron vialii TaxID=182163 RepID=UPI00265FF8F2|nr:NASP-related protein sim3-like [Rhododendron vialii]